MRLLRHNHVFFYVIRGKTVKKMVLIDFLLGTGVYYGIKLISSSLIIASIGSMACCAVTTRKMKGPKIRVLSFS